jgi:hypothetical protein
MIQVLDPFLSFMFGFQHHKADNMLSMVLDPCYNGLGVVT